MCSVNDDGCNGILEAPPALHAVEFICRILFQFSSKFMYSSFASLCL